MVGRVTRRLVRLWRRNFFVVSPKSTLEPTQQIEWLGKLCDFCCGHISNPKGPLAVGVARWLNLATGMCTRKRVQSAVGKFRWMARPHPFLSPLLSGPCAHYLWGPVFSRYTPVAILRSLASALGLAVKGWSPLATMPSFVWNWSKVLSVDAARQRRLRLYVYMLAASLLIALVPGLSGVGGK